MPEKMTTAIERQQSLLPHIDHISYGRLIKRTKMLKCSSYLSFQANGYSLYTKYENAQKNFKIA